MKLLIVLLAGFVVALLGIRLWLGYFDLRLSARAAMSLMLLFTAIGHFAFTRGMVMMIPPFIPFKMFLVYLTGIFEIAAAITLNIPSLYIGTAWLLIAFFILMLPANIYAAHNNINYQKANHSGNGSDYLWFRIPLQLLFIGWVYVNAIWG
jgi:uncharacterized membrane protein